MAIVIAGALELGTYLATTLSEEQESVILIDPDQKRLESFGRSADIATICGEVTDWQLLDSLLDQKPKLFLALTDLDEVNLTASSIAKNLGYPTTVARISNPSFLNQKRLNFDKLFYVDHLIAPELIVAYDLFKAITNPGALRVDNFAHGAVQMRTVVMPSKWDSMNKKLREINFGNNLLIGVIRRKKRSPEHDDDEIIIPHGDDLLFPGDEVTFVGETATMLELPKHFNLPTAKIDSVVIAGSNLVTKQLIRALLDQDIKVKVIDRDEKACLQLAQIYNNITVIHQDPSNLTLLRSERIDRCDVFLAATQSTEFNILTASLAQEGGAKHVYSLVSDTRHFPLLKRLNIDHVLSERECLSSRILSFIHAEMAVSTRTLYDNHIVIMEMKVTASTKIAGIPIQDLSKILPKDCLIALIENRGQIMIAKGERILAPGDTVIVITSPKLVAEIREIF